jgi:anti-sigma regulatory factor (Ser/Thr protein kinase)
VVATAERTFAKSFGSLTDVFGFLDECLLDVDVGERSMMTLHLAVEELFTNMVKYNSGVSREITLQVDTDDTNVRVELIDGDTDPFDPTVARPVDVDLPIEERKRGGLGLHLVQSLVETMDYQYEGREMRVSVTTTLE